MNLWNINGELIRKIEFAENNWASAAAFSPDGHNLIIGYEKEAVIFNLKNKRNKILKVKDEFISQISYSPDGSRINIETRAQNDADYTTSNLLFDNNGKLLKTLPAAISTFFSTDSQRIFLIMGSDIADLQITDRDGKNPENFVFPKNHRLSSRRGNMFPDHQTIILFDSDIRIWVPAENRFFYPGKED